MSKAFKILVTIVAGLSAFVFFVLLFFPLDSIVSHHLANLETLTGGQYRITIEKMEPSLVFDSEFKGIKVFKNDGKGSFDEVFSSEEIKMGISLFSLISQTVDADFSSRFAGGELKGNLKARSGSLVLEVQLKDIDLNKLAVLQNAVQGESFSMDMEGKVNGDLYLSAGQTFRDNESDFALKVNGLSLRNIKASIQSAPLELPNLILSTNESAAIFEGNLESGQLRLIDFTLPGPDIDLQMKGKMNLRQRKAGLQITRTDLKGRFVFSNRVIEKLPILSLVEGQKAADGYYPLELSGSLKKPKIRVGEMDISTMLGF